MSIIDFSPELKTLSLTLYPAKFLPFIFEPETSRQSFFIFLHVKFSKSNSPKSISIASEE